MRDILWNVDEDEKGWDNQTIIKAAEPGRMPVGRFFLLEAVSDEVYMNSKLAIFEDFKIRRDYDEKKETWYFSVVDIIQALLQQPDYQTARKYWNKLKGRLNKEGSESVTNCHRLKPAELVSSALHGCGLRPRV